MLLGGMLMVKTDASDCQHSAYSGLDLFVLGFGFVPIQVNSIRPTYVIIYIKQESCIETNKDNFRIHRGS